MFRLLIFNVNLDFIKIDYLVQVLICIVWLGGIVIRAFTFT